MGSTSTAASELPDDALIAQVRMLAERERRATVDLIVSLAEFDRRSLYLGQGCSSMFTYCTQVLHLSEHAAYGRIGAARAARRFPLIVDMLAAGAITLTTITLLAPHLREDNHRSLLEAARHKSKREVELLAAAIRPQEPLSPSVRKLPTPRIVAALWYGDLSSPGVRQTSDRAMQEDRFEGGTAERAEAPDGAGGQTEVAGTATDASVETEALNATVAVPAPHGASPSASTQANGTSPAVGHERPDLAAAAEALGELPLRNASDGQRRSLVIPLSPERYRIQFTASRETYEKLRRVQDLLRHSVPDGDPSAIFDRALTLLLQHVERTKLASTRRPRGSERAAPVTPGASRRSRHVPAAVRRQVWARDEGRCAFVGAQGRCTERGFLEFHHVMPFAAGGKATVDNIQLRCRAHNTHEAREFFGPPDTVQDSPRDGPEDG